MRRRGNFLVFLFGAILFLAGWWAALDGAQYFPEVLDPNNKVAGIILPHHWFIGVIFVIIGLAIMIREVLR